MWMRTAMGCAINGYRVPVVAEMAGAARRAAVQVRTTVGSAIMGTPVPGNAIGVAALAEVTDAGR